MGGILFPVLMRKEKKTHGEDVVVPFERIGFALLVAGLLVFLGFAYTQEQNRLDATGGTLLSQYKSINTYNEQRTHQVVYEASNTNSLKDPSEWGSLL